jgi:hypothetical protein
MVSMTQATGITAGPSSKQECVILREPVEPDWLAFAELLEGS